MKKVLLVAILAVVVAALIGGIVMWKQQVWIFAPKEAEVETIEAPITEDEVELIVTEEPVP